MRSVTVLNNLSLDGVMQAPGRPDEDRRGGFDRGGWAIGYEDEVKGRTLGQGMAGGGALLLGRRTYEDFFQVWHGRTDNPFSEVLDKMQKYVASRTLTEPLPWQNSTLLDGDAADAVAALKQTDGPNLLIMGSGELVQSLRTRALIDEYMLLIHPLLLGTGRRMFPDGVPADLKLVGETVVTTTGVIIARYQPA
ncbi:dihydrofolate reductase family protein [Actinoplanes sp. N902-109]|uniref:dihydrofolate reductase family protein n=1 Tax=Actinoplanes sp. (strain N902-109) TaxID=649831 RepID=UPI0005A0ECFB|nr:dihydrofolate reductase family protein [Actinoplanes sp. N902-109]